jgi:hypothetical protein
VSLAGIAGCGGGSSEPVKKPAANVPTKASFIAATDALCRQGKAVEPTEGDIIKLLSTVPLPRQHAADVLHGASAEIGRISAKIATLPRPPADAAVLGTWISQVMHVGVLIGRLGDVVAANDGSKLGDTETQIIESAGDPLNFAATYGLTDCDSF